MNYWLYVLSIACIYAGLATSLNLVSGHAGMLSVCQAAFFGIGAYTTALLTLNAEWPWLATVPVAIGLTALPALLVGALALRLRNDYLIVATFAIQVIVYRVMQNWFAVTQGELGVSGIPAASVGPWVLDTPGETLLLAAALLAIVVAAAWRLAFSPFGRLLRAIREDETFVISAGKSAGRGKLVVFVAGACMAAVCGSVYAPIMGHIDPTGFHVMESVFILSVMIIGEAGGFWGPILGAFLLIGLQALLRFTGMPPGVAANVRQIVYGVLLVVLIIWRPQGLLGQFRMGGGHRP